MVEEELKNPVRRYLDDVDDTDGYSLERDKELELAERVQQGDAEAKRELARHNLRLVLNIANNRNYTKRDNNYLESVQEGNIGLMEAIETFDPEEGNKLSTHAYYYIFKQVVGYYKRKRDVVKKPWGCSRESERVDQLKREYKFSNHKEKPMIEWVADEMDISTERVRNIEKRDQENISLDRPASESENAASKLELVREDLKSPEETVKNEKALETLHNALDRLDYRKRRVLELKYGLKDGKERVQEEIGDIFDLSRQRISQIEREAIEDLKEDSKIEEILETSWVPEFN